MVVDHWQYGARRLTRQGTLTVGTLVIVGGGFAGVWAALGAAEVRRRHVSATRRPLDIVLVSRDPWLTIRPRLYEKPADDLRVPLDDVLRPAGVLRVEGDATSIDAAEQRIALEHAGATSSISYDALVLCSGSALQRPAIPGIEHAFSVDSYPEAAALEAHIRSLEGSELDAAATAVVVGAGFTGIEVATALVARVHSIARRSSATSAARVVLVERGPLVAPDLAEVARPHVQQALMSLGIETRVGHSVESIDANGVTFAGGDRIATGTTIWTGGFRASALASHVPVMRDEIGRVPVDEYLRVRGVEHVYAAGDVARAMADGSHVAPMSCQHAIPMGERAGMNAALALLGHDAEAAPYTQSDHVVCLDLGAAGALFVEGWSEAAEVRLTGLWGRRMKEMINTRLIYPDRRLINETYSAA